MRFLSTQIHGILDYSLALLLIASPWLFGFADIGTQAESVIPILLGTGVALYSLFTDYEWGAVEAYLWGPIFGLTCSEDFFWQLRHGFLALPTKCICHTLF